MTPGLGSLSGGGPMACDRPVLRAPASARIGHTLGCAGKVTPTLPAQRPPRGSPPGSPCVPSSPRLTPPDPAPTPRATRSLSGSCWLSWLLDSGPGPSHLPLAGRHPDQAQAPALWPVGSPHLHAQRLPKPSRPSPHVSDRPPRKTAGVWEVQVKSKHAAAGLENSLAVPQKASPRYPLTWQSRGWVCAPED